MRILLMLFSILFLCSCIPLQIAPKIETYRVIKPKRFKCNIPRGYGFVFEDPKEANAFFTYLQFKFRLPANHSFIQIPQLLDQKLYFLSFCEQMRNSKKPNLLPIAIDNVLEANELDPFLQDSYLSRRGKWYVIIRIQDLMNRDALHPKHPSQKPLILYLDSLRKEYIHTHNYWELYFK